MESFVGEWPSLERGWSVPSSASFSKVTPVCSFTNVFNAQTVVAVVIAVYPLPAEGPVGGGVEFIVFYGEFKMFYGEGVFWLEKLTHRRETK